MTLESTISRNVYDGNGATVAFPFTFRVWDASHLAVYLTSPAGRTTPALGWTAELTASGGTVTYRHNGIPLPEGWRLAIIRNMPFTQGVDLVSGARFDPQVMEDALDQAAAERQQLRELVDRAVRMPATSEETPEDYGNALLDARDDACACAAQAAQGAGEARKHAAEAAEIKANALRELREEGAAQAERLDELAANHILTFERELERAHDEADRAEAEADRARDEADRAEAAADRADTAVKLGSGVENLERTLALDRAIPAGGTLDLEPFGLAYYVGRHTLRLNWEGVELFRGEQFEEIGEDGEVSRAVRLLIDIPAGDRLNVWVVVSNLARHAEEEAERAEAEADRAREEADRACACADEARACADEAEKQADIAKNAAQEATEQADRAEKAADDAEEAANDARFTACMLGKGRITPVREEASLADVPTGFYIVDPSLPLPVLCPRPLTSLERPEDIPPGPDFFFVLAGKMECVPPDGSGTDPEGPGDPGDGPHALCGQRLKKLAQRAIAKTTKE